MLETSHCLRTRSDIFEIKKLDNNLIAVATQLHGVKLFSPATCETKVALSHENINHEVTAYSCSLNSELMVFSKASFIYILHISSNTILKTIKADGEIIEELEFDLESKYIIAATQSGRVLQYRYDGSSLLARLYSFQYTSKKLQKTSTAVSTFSFYKNLMACGGHNGTIFTINLHSRTNKIILQNTKERITSLCFLDATELISADVKGNLYFNSLKNETLTTTITTSFRKITKIVRMFNPNYLMVLGDDNYVSVYNVYTYKLLHHKYIEFEDTITDIIVVDATSMIAVLKNNSIEKIKLTNIEKLSSFIIHNNLDKAYNLVRIDPLLHDTKEFLSLEAAYKKIYEQALDALKKQNKDIALQVLSIFKYVESKREDIDILFKAFENYGRFKALYMEKKYALAYAMAAKFPPLMTTFQYIKMEEYWKDTFKNAQRQIAHGREENALLLLNEFAAVAQKRPIIKLILNFNDDFIRFLKALESRDFQTIEKIVIKNELFTLIPTYKNVPNEMQKQIVKIGENITNCELDAALTKLTRLKNIASIKEIVETQIQECKAVKKLQDAYEENDFILCYEIIDKYNVLHATKLGNLLQNHWAKLSSIAEGYALKGNIKEIKNTLGELIHLKTRRDKIGDLFRLAFHSQIKGQIAKQLYKKAEALVYSYIDIFGLDREILSIMGMYEFRSKTKLAITNNQNMRVERNKWIESEVILGPTP
ncbi:hypothetical protein JHD48_05985 [Sulfurimonas sp. SAG-AH-194-I05]|nr:hypothetical protein [Sulfurimonas sp. SAG-AH-194-I05]MDF1875276.1 hypothetical protein [Sulfurimonas sp. SAG-AH-194-I05]